MNKFYNFVTDDMADELYLYGAIVSEKWSEDDVTFNDFKEKVDAIKEGATLNIYINSPGGEVFVTDSIISILGRAKELKNIEINCYIDGLAASCASWLPMIADHLYVYPQSIMMLHKPMAGVRGNANDMLKEIEVLNKIEDSMIKMYMSKVKDGVDEEQLKKILADETWLTCDEIGELFNVEVIEAEKKVVACIDRDIMKNYKKTPECLLEENVEEEEPVEEEVIEPVEEVKEEVVEEEKAEEPVVEVEEVVEEEPKEIAEEPVEEPEVIEEPKEELEEQEEVVEDAPEEAEIEEEPKAEDIKDELKELSDKMDMMEKKLALYLELGF